MSPLKNGKIPPQHFLLHVLSPGGIFSPRSVTLAVSAVVAATSHRHQSAFVNYATYSSSSLFVFVLPPPSTSARATAYGSSAGIGSYYWMKEEERRLFSTITSSPPSCFSFSETPDEKRGERKERDRLNYPA